VPRRELQRFLCLAAPPEQDRLWRQRLETRRLKAALRLALDRRLLRLAYAGVFPAILPPRFDLAVRERLARTFARHPNRDNPYAWRLLLGSDPPEGEEPLSPLAAGTAIDFACADAAEFLERCPEGSFDGFSLSNVLDAAPPPYRERLLAAVGRAAAPGAVAVLRSFLPPGDDAAALWAARDRSPLWGGIEVLHIR